MEIIEIDRLGQLPPSLHRNLYVDCERNECSHPNHASIAGKMPSSWILYDFPQAMICDNSIAGPMRSPLSFLLQQNKFWFPSGEQVSQMLQRSDFELISMPGVAIQLSACCGWHFNHFALDSLIRLAAVYERLLSHDPVWREAKIIMPFGEHGFESSIHELKPTVRWILEKLGLIDRLHPNNGWLAKAKQAHYFDRVFMPDVDIHFRSKNSQAVNLPIFTRNILRPIQKALGVLDDSVERNLILWADREGLIRGVCPDRKREILSQLQRCLDRFHQENPEAKRLEIHEFQHSTAEADCQLIKRAVAILGPHGQQLWNMIFSQPGTLVLEFATWEDLFEAKDNRPCGYSIANAAGHSYHVIETENFDHFFGRNVRPDTEAILIVIQSYLFNDQRERS